VNPQWWSQQFAPEGSAAADGINKQLGVPSLDPLTVLVREAAQNSWDARRDDDGVDFRVSIRRLGDHHAAWRRRLLPAPDARAAVGLEEGLRPDSTIVVVSDRGTVGLGGPVRAGRRATGPERPDFVQFLRNVGEPSDHEFGGGTYGFGKGIFFRLSAASTILVDTRTASGGPLARRLMGTALGRSWFDDNDLRYTGRHWWGEIVDDIPDPLTGATADETAAELGLPGFADGQTGTDVVIVAADLGSSWGEDDGTPRDMEAAGQFIASSMLWHLWPKMVAEANSVPMRFAVDVDGRNVRVPTPDSVREIRGFADALRRIRAGDGARFTRSVAPRTAGFFALEAVSADIRNTVDPLVVAARPFVPPSRHVARMRTAELVVDYLPGPPHPDPLLAYASVFKAAPEADSYFAGAEPPTHDDWVERGLTGTARGVLQGCRRFITKQLDDALAPKGVGGGTDTTGLGELALRLSALIPGGILSDRTSGESAVRNGSSRVGEPGDLGAGAPGGGYPASGGRPGTGVGRPRLIGTPTVQVDRGQPYIAALVRIPTAPHERLVEAQVQVVVDGGGIESEAPPGASMPDVLQWQHATTRATVHGAVLGIAAGDGGDWWVLASYVPDAVVRFKIRLVGDQGVG
jgi:hypothetical protein